MLTKRVRISILGALAALGVGAVVFVSVNDGRSDIDVQEMILPDSGFARYLPGGYNATSTLCDDRLRCESAVDSETVSILKFSSQEDASDVARQFGESGYHSGFIALRFKDGELSPADRQEFITGLDGVNTNSPD